MKCCSALCRVHNELHASMPQTNSWPASLMKGLPSGPSGLQDILLQAISPERQLVACTLEQSQTLIWKGWPLNKCLVCCLYYSDRFTLVKRWSLGKRGCEAGLTQLTVKRIKNCWVSASQCLGLEQLSTVQAAYKPLSEWKCCSHTVCCLLAKLSCQFIRYTTIKLMKESNSKKNFEIKMSMVCWDCFALMVI